MATAVVKTREMSTPQKQASVLAFRGGCLAMVMVVAGETSKPTKTSLNAHFWVVAGGHLVGAQFIVKYFFQETKPHLFRRWT